MVAGVALGLWVARVYAGQAAPSAGPAGPPATEEACTAACQVLIDRCTGTFGPAMGDMRPYCTRAVIRRCKATGIKSCEVVASEPAGESR